MLIGEYKAKLGDKNRTALPKKLRDELKGEIIITRGYEGCLILLDKEKWQKLIKLVEVKPLTNQDVRNTKRFLIGGANEVELDFQARFVIPEQLKEYAHLENEITFIGIIDWIEIWSEAKWNKKINNISENAADIADRLSEISN
jgi:MraZ protein